MDDVLRRSLRVQDQGDRFEAALAGSGVAPERVRMAKERYLAARAVLVAYERQVADAYGKLGLSSGKRRILQPLAQKLYGLSRRYTREKLYGLLAESVRDRLIRGAEWAEVLAVVEAGMRALGLAYSPQEAETLRKLVEVKVQSADGKVQDGGTDAERARTVPGARRARIAGAVQNVVTNYTEWEAERERLAVRNLKYALAGHHQIVKEVVARRLCEHRSFDELAARFEITREDVETILERMRMWVNRFTAYFSDEWYWRDGGAKFIMPRH